MKPANTVRSQYFLTTVRIVASIVTLASLTACENAKELGFAAVALPGIVAYDAADRALALGPEPRQAANHPVTGTKITAWKIADGVVDLAWRNESELVVQTNTGIELWDVQSRPSLRVHLALTSAFQGILDPNKGAAILHRGFGSQIGWMKISETGLTEQPHEAVLCATVAMAADGQSIVCDTRGEIKSYSVETGAAEWSLSREDPKHELCVPDDQHCRAQIVAAADGLVANASLFGPVRIATHSRSDETRVLDVNVSGSISELEYAPSAKLLVADVDSQQGNRVYILDSSDGTVRVQVSDPAQLMPLRKFKVSSDDRFACGATKAHGLVVIDLRSGKREEFKTGERFEFANCNISADGAHLIMAVVPFGALIGPSQVYMYTLNT